MRPFLFSRQSKFPECPITVRCGGSVVGLDNTRDFLMEVIPMAKKKEKLTESENLIRRAGLLLQAGSVRGFILYQVLNCLVELELAELKEMSKAVAYFENLARRKQFMRKIQEELPGEWEAKLFKVEEKEAAA
jgi:hypothetical protein